MRFMVSRASYHRSSPVGVAALKRASGYAFSTLHKYLFAIHATVQLRASLSVSAGNTDYALRSVDRLYLVRKSI